ncbi:MAG TPA: hypothetical protein VF708_10225 [Pyrinomonadaceae bacterium]
MSHRLAHLWGGKIVAYRVAAAGAAGNQREGIKDSNSWIALGLQG